MQIKKALDTQECYFNVFCTYPRNQITKPATNLDIKTKSTGIRFGFSLSVEFPNPTLLTEKAMAVILLSISLCLSKLSVKPNL
jgi:hypothetical protein